MVKSQVVSVTPAQHADNHRHGGSDPLTGDVRIDLTPYITPVEVFNGNSPLVLTQLDISAVTGANSYIVVMEISRSGTSNASNIYFQMNGLATGAAPEYGINCGVVPATGSCRVVTITDANGILEWDTENAQATIVKVVAVYK